MGMMGIVGLAMMRICTVKQSNGIGQGVVDSSDSFTGRLGLPAPALPLQRDIESENCDVVWGHQIHRIPSDDHFLGMG